jgi:hypothetical protein
MVVLPGPVPLPSSGFSTTLGSSILRVFSGSPGRSHGITSAVVPLPLHMSLGHQFPRDRFLHLTAYRIHRVDLGVGVHDSVVLLLTRVVPLPPTGGPTRQAPGSGVVPNSPCYPQTPSLARYPQGYYTDSYYLMQNQGGAYAIQKARGPLSQCNQYHTWGNAWRCPEVPSSPTCGCR